MYKVMVKYAGITTTFAACLTFDAAVRMADSLNLEAWVIDPLHEGVLYTNR